MNALKTKIFPESNYKSHIKTPQEVILSKFHVQLAVFYSNSLLKDKKPFNHIKSKYHNAYAGITPIIKLKNWFYHKSSAIIDLGPLRFVGSHMPFNPKNEANTSMRENALNDVLTICTGDKVSFILGDLNFRNINGQDQLKEFLEGNKNIIDITANIAPTCKTQKFINISKCAQQYLGKQYSDEQYLGKQYLYEQYSGEQYSGEQYSYLSKQSSEELSKGKYFSRFTKLFLKKKNEYEEDLQITNAEEAAFKKEIEDLDEIPVETNNCFVTKVVKEDKILLRNPSMCDRILMVDNNNYLGNSFAKPIFIPPINHSDHNAVYGYVELDDSILLQSAGKPKGPLIKATTERVLIGKRNAIVYVTKQGTKYIKKDGKICKLTSLTSSVI
jgi:hypothetical protein